MFTDIACTVYAVTDIKKSRAFYEGILGLKPSDEFPATDGTFWIEYSIGSGALAIGCAPDWKPSQDGAVVMLETPDFEATVKKLKAAGVQFKLEPQEFPPCWMAVSKDPDMNNITIHHKKVK
jgi:predicted enzyme related to lactoylglutathione lyase